MIWKENILRMGIFLRGEGEKEDTNYFDTRSNPGIAKLAANSFTLGLTANILRAFVSLDTAHPFVGALSGDGAGSTRSASQLWGTEGLALLELKTVAGGVTNLAAGIGCANTDMVVAASKLEGPAGTFLAHGARKDSRNAQLSEGSSNSNVCNLHSNRVYKK